MKYLFTILLAALLVGCGKKPESATTPTVSPETAALHGLPPIQVPAQAGEVLARVGTRELTRGQATQDADIRLASIASQVPPSEIERMRQQTIGRIVEQFVIRSLLLDEAAKADIAVTAEDQEMALAQIDEHLRSQGRSLNEALETSPIGRDRMLEEVRVGITIDKLMAARLADSPDPTDEEIDAFVQEHAAQLNRPERLHARHILLSTDGSTDEADLAAKREAAQALRAELEAGADFETLAREHSTCPSAARGGDLGWFGRGQMVKPFEDAAFALEPMAVSDVVETQFGFHVIQSLEREAAGQPPREELIEIVKQSKRQSEVRDLVESLLEQADVEYAESIVPLLPDTVRR